VRGISREIIEVIKHRKDTIGLDEADAIVIELGREIVGARKVASANLARSLRQFGRRALVDLVALMGNYAGTAALLTAPSTCSSIPVSRGPRRCAEDQGTSAQFPKHIIGGKGRLDVNFRTCWLQ
jgi:hypothetical protein